MVCTFVLRSGVNRRSVPREHFVAHPPEPVDFEYCMILVRVRYRKWSDGNYMRVYIYIFAALDPCPRRTNGSRCCSRRASTHESDTCSVTFFSVGWTRQTAATTPATGSRWVKTGRHTHTGRGLKECKTLDPDDPHHKRRRREIAVARSSLNSGSENNGKKDD